MFAIVEPDTRLIVFKAETEAECEGELFENGFLYAPNAEIMEFPDSDP